MTPRHRRQLAISPDATNGGALTHFRRAVATARASSSAQLAAASGPRLLAIRRTGNNGMVAQFAFGRREFPLHLEQIEIETQRRTGGGRAGERARGGERERVGHDFFLSSASNNEQDFLLRHSFRTLKANLLHYRTNSHLAGHRTRLQNLRSEKSAPTWSNSRRSSGSQVNWATRCR